MNRFSATLCIVLIICLSLACNISFQQEQKEPDLDATIAALQSGGSSSKTDIDPNCDSISNIKDVNYPDGSIVESGEAFNKTWSMQNTGTCTWTSGYRVALISALDYSVMESYSLNQVVTPGNTVNITVPVRAPLNEGAETYYYMLVNESGKVFGFGENSEKPFWVNFRISGDPQVAVNETENEQQVEEVQQPQEVEEESCILSANGLQTPVSAYIDFNEGLDLKITVTNTGTCAWDANSHIEPIKGDTISTVNYLTMGKTINPGDKAELILPVWVENESGDFYQYWKLVTQHGELRNFGNNTDNRGMLVAVHIREEEEPEFIIDWGMQKMTWIGLQKCGTVPANPILEMQVDITSVNFEGDVIAQVTIGGTTSYPLPTHTFNTSFNFDNGTYQKEFSISPGETKTLNLELDTSSSSTHKYLNDFIEGSIWFHIKYLNQVVTNDLNNYSKLPFEHTCIK